MSGELLACNLCDGLCRSLPKKAEGIKVEWEKNAFIMNLESNWWASPGEDTAGTTKMLDNN